MEKESQEESRVSGPKYWDNVHSDQEYRKYMEEE